MSQLLDGTPADDAVGRAYATLQREIRQQDARRKEMHDKERHELHNQLKNLREEAARVAELEAEIKCLRGTLSCSDNSVQQEQTISQQASEIYRLKRDNEFLREDRDRAIQSCSELDRKHDHMRRQATEFKEAWHDAVKRYQSYKSKFHNSKGNIRDWQAFADLVSPPTSSHSRNLSGYSGKTNQPAVGNSGKETTPAFQQLDQRSLDMTGGIHQTKPQASMTPPHHESDDSAFPRSKDIIPSSQSTDDDIPISTEMQSMVKQEQPSMDSSPPEVVYERPAPGRRVNLQARVGMRTTETIDGSLEQPCLVKDESSILPQLFDMPQLPKSETFDLDEPNAHVDTPRKRRRLERMRTLRRANGLSQRMASNLGFERASSAPLEASHPELQEQESLLNISFHNQAPQPAEREEPEPIDPEFVSPNISAEVGPRRRREQNVLRPVNPNPRLRSGPTPSSTKSKKGKSRDSDIKYFTEDGESFSRVRGNGRVAHGGDQAAQSDKSTVGEDGSKQSRVQALLEGANTFLDHTLRTPTARIKANLPTDAAQTPHGQAGAVRQLPRTAPTVKTSHYFPKPETPRTAPVSRRRHHSPIRPRVDDNQSKPSPARVPLRSQPVKALQLSDFRINPATNDGETFAFHETLRKAAEKACRPGCVDPDCCGGVWRSLAQMEYAGRTIESDNRENDETSDERGRPKMRQEWSKPALDDHQLIVNHLGGGPEAQKRARNMSPNSRKDIIIEARATELAEKHGKHRQRFQRHRTPPGYWRTEFPDTQEGQNDREQAQKLETGLVKERLREALKGRNGGGLWLFADE